MNSTAIDKLSLAAISKDVRMICVARSVPLFGTPPHYSAEMLLIYGAVKLSPIILVKALDRWSEMSNPQELSFIVYSPFLSRVAILPPLQAIETETSLQILRLVW